MPHHPITGAIPRIQPVWTHRELVRAATPPLVLLRLDGAKELCDEGETAESAFPAETEVITCAARLSPNQTAFTDSTGPRTRMKEAALVKQFEPAYHVLAESPLDTRPPESESTAFADAADCQRYRGELRWFDTQLAASRTTPIPCVQSPASVDADCSREVFDQVDPPIVATTISPEPLEEHATGPAPTSKIIQYNRAGGDPLPNEIPPDDRYADPSQARPQAPSEFPLPDYGTIPGDPSGHMRAGCSSEATDHATAADSSRSTDALTGADTAGTSQRPFLVIGSLDPAKLSRESLPASTCAAAGLDYWRRTVQPEIHSTEEIRSAFTTVQEDVRASLPNCPP